jgi:NAD(P)-dependent dehydrogenase (short-subunit alcohol dehydrogenase family)
VETFVEKMAGAEGVSKDQMKREFVSQNRPTSLLQRFASPEEVAGFVAYLASPRAAAVTGSAHRVEGGIVNTCF